MQFFKKKVSNKVFSPIDGNVFPLSELNDGVFSKLLLGDGFGFEFKGKFVCSPCFGKIIFVADTKHAMGIMMDNGAELLLHIGLDTVNLNGKGMKPLVKAGDVIRPGKKILSLDRDFLDQNHVNMRSALIVSNDSEYILTKRNCKEVKIKDELFTLTEKE